MGELITTPDAVLACVLAPKALRIEGGYCTPVSGKERCDQVLKSLEHGVQRFEGEQCVLVAGGGKVDTAVWDDVAVGVYGSFENMDYLRGKVEADGDVKEAGLVARLFRKFGEAASLTKIWGQFSFIACDLKNDRVFAARSTLSPVELIEARLDDDVIVVVSNTARDLLAGAGDVTTLQGGFYVSGHRRATVPIQFKHTEEELELATQASLDAVSRALANMPALLTSPGGSRSSRPATPEIAPAPGGAWSSRARRQGGGSPAGPTSTSGPTTYAADAKGAESAATWRRSSFDGPRRTSHDGPRRGSAEFKRRGSLDLPSKTTAWVPAATGYHEEMQGGGGGAAAGGGGHGSGAHVPTTVDEGNEGEGEAGTPRSRAQAQSSSRSLVGNVASWVLGAFGGKKPSEPNLEQNGEAARRVSKDGTPAS